MRRNMYSNSDRIVKKPVKRGAKHHKGDKLKNKDNEKESRTRYSLVIPWLPANFGRYHITSLAVQYLEAYG